MLTSSVVSARICGPRIATLRARGVAITSAMKLESRVCVVTGANRGTGIGLELVKQLLAKGNTVIATARTPGAASELQQVVSGAPAGRAFVTELDVAAPASVERWAAAVAGLVPHVDLLINNAGVASWGSLSDVTADEMLRLFTTNAIGPLLVTQQLRKAGLLGSKNGGGGGGSLIANMTSKMGSVDDNGSGGTYAYRASKAALNIINKSLSIDLAGEGVTSVLLHPGYVRTDMTGGNGLISTQTCATGLLSVLEREEQELQGRWFDYAGKEVPW